MDATFAFLSYQLVDVNAISLIRSLGFAMSSICFLISSLKGL